MNGLVCNDKPAKHKESRSGEEVLAGDGDDSVEVSILIFTQLLTIETSCLCLMAKTVVSQNNVHSQRFIYHILTKYPIITSAKEVM